ncbi:MAG: alpha/beta fold hydrolase [Actinomycetota bacterium]
MSQEVDKNLPNLLAPTPTRPEYPLFVFLPGMDESTKLPLLQTASLNPAFDVRFLMIPPDFNTSWSVLAERVISLIDAELKQTPRHSVYLGGESFGGCLALKVLEQAPRLFDKIILVNPASSFNQYPWIHWGSLISRLLPESLYQILSLAFVPFLANLRRITPTNRQALLKSVQSTPIKSSVQRLSLLRHFELNQQSLHQITQPVLIVASKGDRLLPSVAEAKRLLKIFPHAQSIILPHSGHACLLEADVSLLKILETAASSSKLS